MQELTKEQTIQANARSSKSYLESIAKKENIDINYLLNIAMTKAIGHTETPRENLTLEQLEKVSEVEKQIWSHIYFGKVRDVAEIKHLIGDFNGTRYKMQ